MTLGDEDDTRMPSVKNAGGGVTGQVTQAHLCLPPGSSAIFLCFSEDPPSVHQPLPKRPEMPGPPPTLQLGEQRFSLAGPQSLCPGNPRIPESEGP